MKFHVGQKVRVVKVSKDGDTRHVGQCGKVMTATSYGYRVLLDTWDEDAIFFEDELEPTRQD